MIRVGDTMLCIKTAPKAGFIKGNLYKVTKVWPRKRMYQVTTETRYKAICKFLNLGDCLVSFKRYTHNLPDWW